MAFTDLLVTEIFHSLQGETSLSGVPFAFIRLAGCNLRCTYCDSSYSFKGGKRLRISEVIKTIEPYQVSNVLITGGEPLLQRQTPHLAIALKAKGYRVSIETHGGVPIRSVAEHARLIMDIKTPASGMERGGYLKNFQYLKPGDEIKFVIASKQDYIWAKELVQTGKLPNLEILFSAAVPALNCPGTFEGVSSRWLADKILEDRLPVRLQIQLHKHLWGYNVPGV